MFVCIGGHDAVGQPIDHNSQSGFGVGYILQCSGVSQGFFNNSSELVRCKGLGNKVKSTFFHRFNGMFQGSITGYDYNDGVRVKGSYLRENIEARYGRKHEVDQDNIKMTLLYHQQPLFTVCCHLDVIAFICKDNLAGISNSCFIIYHENLWSTVEFF